MYCRRACQCILKSACKHFRHNVNRCAYSSLAVCLGPRELLRIHVSSQRSLDLSRRKSFFRRSFMTIPNCLCIFRMGITPVIGWLVIGHHFLPACSLFIVAAVTDLLDGYIARNVRGQSSSLGSVIDPVADKILITTMFLTLTHVNLIPPLLTVLVILRDIGLVTGGMVKRFKMLAPPVTLKRFFSLSISPFIVTPTVISKVNTALQLSVVTFSMTAPVFGFLGHPLLSYLYIVTAMTTISSGVQYALFDGMKRF